MKTRAKRLKESYMKCNVFKNSEHFECGISVEYEWQQDENVMKEILENINMAIKYNNISHLYPSVKLLENRINAFD